jgi:hypothetical protein
MTSGRSGKAIRKKGVKEVKGRKEQNGAFDVTV